LRAERQLKYKKVRANSIKALYLPLNRLGPEGVREIVDAIRFQQRSTGPGILSNNGLQMLYVDANVIGDLGAQAISELIMPVGTDVYGSILFSAPAQLLNVISLRSNRITDKGATILLDAISKASWAGLKNIRALMLDDNPISPGILNQIRLKLEINCCSQLYSIIFNRRMDATLNEGASKFEANEIREYYRVREMCCQRIKWDSCA